MFKRGSHVRVLQMSFLHFFFSKIEISSETWARAGICFVYRGHWWLPKSAPLWLTAKIYMCSSFSNLRNWTNSFVLSRRAGWLVAANVSSHWQGLSRQMPRSASPWESLGSSSILKNGWGNPAETLYLTNWLLIMLRACWESRKLHSFHCNALPREIIIFQFVLFPANVPTRDMTFFSFPLVFMLKKKKHFKASL